MPSSIKRLALLLAALALPAFAQEAPVPGGDKPVGADAAAAPGGAKSAGDAGKAQETEKAGDVAVPGKEAAAGAEAGPESGKVVGADPKDEVKILQPQDVPTELTRLKSKADIKAEVTVKPHHGRSAVFKGVIRNGKLIEMFTERRFVPQKGVEDPRSGVRLWWIGGSSGWMFFRYANIKSLTLTGTLTEEERKEILERLQAKKTEEATKADPVAELDEQLEKMSPEELDAYLVRQYPADKGWDQQKVRALKKQAIIENKPLDRDEAVFVRYYNTLLRARLKLLKARSKTTEIEIDHGSEPKEDDAPGHGSPSGSGSGVDDPDDG